MAPVTGGSNVDDTPPGSPTTPIAPFQAQYGQQHQQLQLQLQQQRSRVHSPPPSSRSPASSRAFGQPSSGMEPPQRSSSAAAPGADTSINSISSSHSYSSLNSNGQGHNGSFTEGAASIISNSILTNAVNQSMANSGVMGGGMNSNNSFFSVKQSSISRGISTNLSGTSPTGSPSPQQDRVSSSVNTSPGTSGAITRPPMSSQRNRDNASSKSASHPVSALANTSFSSVGSVEGSAPASIIPCAAAEVVAQEGSSMASRPAIAVSTAIANVSQPAAVVSGSGTSSTANPAPTSSSNSTGSSRSQHTASTASSHGQRQQQSHVHAHPNSHSPSSNGQGQGHHQGHGHGHGHGHGSHGTVPKEHRLRVDASKDTPRPSTTVPHAPTPAMHWTRAKVHGQILPKDLRAQTVNLVGESIYIFGGCDAKNTCFNFLYIFDADTMHWSQPKTYGSIPPPCRAHSSTLVDNKRLYVFGGGDGPQYFNELYMLDTDTLTWTNPQTTGTRPCRRRAHTACVYNNHIYVFGGGDGVQALRDTYQLDLATMHWSEVKTTGTIPLSRGYHTSNLIKSHFIIFGGSDGQDCFSDVHVLDLDTKEWTKIDINRPLKRLSHTSTQVGSYLFVIGGHDGNRYSCDVVMLNLVTWSWETRKVYGIPPAGRGYHASLLYDSRLFVFGGYDGHTVYDDIYVLDLSTCAYLPQITDFQILLRRAELPSEQDAEGQLGGS